MSAVIHAWPPFKDDPYGWFQEIGRVIVSPEWPHALATIELDAWDGEHGNAWRVVRSTRGVEVRPSLISPFIRFSDLPRVTAIALGGEVDIELSCRRQRWIDRFPRDSFDVAALGHAMLEERELPHDNLPRLFPLPDP